MTTPGYFASLCLNEPSGACLLSLGSKRMVGEAGFRIFLANSPVGSARLAITRSCSKVSPTTLEASNSCTGIGVWGTKRLADGK